MQSAELPSSDPPLSTDNSPWNNVRRVYRRMCVLRATGKAEAAAALEHGELRQALTVARVSAPAVDEAALFVQEEDRVAEAEVLAELLAPLLAEKLRVPRPAGEHVRAPVVGEESSPTPPSGGAPPGRAVPDIADFIDGMLAQDKPAAPRGRR